MALLKHPPATVTEWPIRPFRAPVRLVPHPVTIRLQATALLRVKGTLSSRHYCIGLALNNRVSLLVHSIPFPDPSTPLLLVNS